MDIKTYALTVVALFLLTILLGIHLWNSEKINSEQNKILLKAAEKLHIPVHSSTNMAKEVKSVSLGKGN